MGDETLIALEVLRAFAGYGIFNGFRLAPTFLSGWATFLGFIVTSRLLVSLHAGEPLLTVYTLLGLALLLCGIFITTTKNNSAGVTALAIALLLAFGIIGGNDIMAIFTTTGITPGWWMAWLFLAALSIAGSEYAARKWQAADYFPPLTSVRAFFTTPSQWLWLWPISFAINAGLFYGYTYAMPTFLFAWAVYTIYDVVLRIGNNLLMREPFTFTHGLGMTLILSGTLLTYLGGTTP